MLPLRSRVLVASLIGVSSGSFCFWLTHRLQLGAGDFAWALHLAERWLARQPLYDTPLEQYPFTAALFALPLVRLPRELAAGLFYGISSALLAFGLTREGYGRLLMFLAYPYWIALLYVQWSPLIAASALFPLLLPATMAKPQVGLPILLTRLSRRGLWACLMVGIISVCAAPRWPLLWLSQAANYQHFIAVLVLPGPLILLALFRYRDRDAILLLLTSVMPQRWFFDAFILWLIPKTRREMIITIFFSWAGGIWRWYHAPHSFSDVGRWIVLSIYLPMLAIILLRQHPTGMARKV